jgi:hypothetical protein
MVASNDFVDLIYHNRQAKSATLRDFFSTLLEVWETLVPLLMELHPEYARCIQAQEIYHDMKILVYLCKKS